MRIVHSLGTFPVKCEWRSERVCVGKFSIPEDVEVVREAVLQLVSKSSDNIPLSSFEFVKSLEIAMRISVTLAFLAIQAF